MTVLANPMWRIFYIGTTTGSILGITSGRFTPIGRANSPYGQLHEISAFFGLEAGLNYTL
jgi:hypothetical protein